jgi:hypothetical protein
VWGNGCPEAYTPDGATDIVVCQFTPELLLEWGFNFSAQAPPTAPGKKREFFNCIILCLIFILFYLHYINISFLVNVNGYMVDPSLNPISCTGMHFFSFLCLFYIYMCVFFICF